MKLILATLAVLISWHSVAQDFVGTPGEEQNNGVWTYKIDKEGNAIFTGCVEDCPHELTVPQFIAGASVVAVDPGYLLERASFVSEACPSYRLSPGPSITIPDGVARIGNYAFSGCAVDSLTLGAGIREIDRAAFQAVFLDEGRPPPRLPEGLLKIGAEAFKFNFFSGSVTIPASVQVLGWDAFDANDFSAAYFNGDRGADISSEAFGAIFNVNFKVFYCIGRDGWPGENFGCCIPPQGRYCDSDGDGLTDDLDVFADDPNETIDTDGDGIGNNADDDDDGDGVPDDEDFLPIDSSEQFDSDGDGVGDNSDVFPNDAAETIDTDSDGVGDNADVFAENPLESADTDGDGIGNNADLDDDNDGFTDEEELADGTNPLSRFSCRQGCFSFDIDENSKAKALTDGLLVIRHLFGFTGDALATGAISTDATRDRAEDISALLADADSELDIDGNGESKALTDGLLLIRYLFGFTGDALTSGAIGDGASRDTSEAIEAYISDRVPASE